MYSEIADTFRRDDLPHLFLLLKNDRFYHSFVLEYEERKGCYA